MGSRDGQEERTASYLMKASIKICRKSYKAANAQI